ncbi:L,D-transpeptidase family protein [Sphingomonas donggukensis]|uniref:L,D-transpeptidase family protein n=1 Tax=Sphingomonas donggukensis TaxID=2949093 RepID=A0ABY4TVJ1_9SPHN|nr:L,D-transpeptidase family protein [Sphingomonas donggukensis]URW76353.1 L,D-transpeptidase family protein [Sphingomonas donggukensis]
MRRRMAAILGMLAAASLFGVPASAEPRQPVSLEVAAQSLDAGQYYWRDDDPTAGEIAIVISRSAQVAYVWRGQVLIGIASVSTGKPGKSTPVGAFTILQKRVFHRSNLYSNAPMPYMQRLTWDGIALHAGHNPGYPASHGCVRLPRAFAVLLYGVTRMGGAVAIVDEDRPVALPERRFPIIIADVGGFDNGNFAEVTWQPADFAAIDPPRETLSVRGDEWMVPDALLDLPARGRRF